MTEIVGARMFLKIWPVGTPKTLHHEPGGILDSLASLTRLHTLAKMQGWASSIVTVHAKIVKARPPVPTCRDWSLAVPPGFHEDARVRDLKEGHCRSSLNDYRSTKVL